MNMKKHYKLYKSGKLWVTAAIATLALTTGMAVTTTNASADNQPAVRESGTNTSDSVSDSTTTPSASGSEQGQTSEQPGADHGQTPADDKGQTETQTVTVTRQINFVTTDEKGNKTSTTSNQTATFTRTDTVYKDTTKNKIGQWQAASANKDTKLEMPEFKIPAKDKYVSKTGDKQYTDTVPALALTEDQLNKALQANKQTGSITLDAVTVTYVPSNSKKVIKPTADNQKKNAWDNSKKADDPANQQAVWKAVTRTINIVSIQGGDLKPVVQTVWYNRTVTVTTTIDSKVEQKTKYEPSDWQLADGQTATWPEFDVPQISNFHSLIDGKQQIIVPSLDVKANTEDQNVNVTYDNEANDPVNSDVTLGLQGNWGYLDSMPTVDSQYQDSNHKYVPTIHVNGWNATNDSRRRNYHYIIILDYGPNASLWGDTRTMPFHEVGRVLVQNEISRPDVKAVHNVWNAGRSGFDVNVPINLAGINPGDRLAVLMRWTSDPDGNPSTVQNDNSELGSADLYSQLFTIDYGTNAGSLDSMAVTKDNKLHVEGWHASNSALGNRSHHFLILWDQNLGREVKRIEVNNSVDRSDVAKVYPGLLNAAHSGYSADFNLNGVDLSHNLLIVSRYSDSATGEGSNIDYWSAAKNLINNESDANQANLDSVNIGDAGKVHVAGWHATNAANTLEPNQYLILWDATDGKQVAATAVKTTERGDVQKVFPYFASDKYGFDADLNVQLEAGHHYDLISRYSTSSDAKGNGDDGSSAYTDYWFNDAIVMDNKKANHLDSVKKDSKGNIVLSGWMTADESQSRPYAYVILLHNGQEIARQNVTLTSRTDVPENGYANFYNSANSGLDNVTFTLDAGQQKALQNGSIQFILRFTNDKAGNGNFVDQHSGSYNYNALPVIQDDNTKPDAGNGKQSNQSDQQQQQPTDKKADAKQGK